MPVRLWNKFPGRFTEKCRVPRNGTPLAASAVAQSDSDFIEDHPPVTGAKCTLRLPVASTIDWRHVTFRVIFKRRKIAEYVAQIIFSFTEAV